MRIAAKILAFVMIALAAPLVIMGAVFLVIGAVPAWYGIKIMASSDRHGPLDRHPKKRDNVVPFNRPPE